MSNFHYTKANLKRLSKNALYKMLYSQFITPLTRGQVIAELENRIPHHIYYKDGKRMRHFIVGTPALELFDASVWEIEQADLKYTVINGAT
jgi:hypothetical protein